jgi:formiminotetrahydrofolate cyclodeaminase
MKLIEYKIINYIKEISKGKPTPGGGSVSSLVLSLGLGLFLMCLEFSKNKIKEEDYKKRKEEINKLLEEALELIDRDKIAYNLVDKALKLPSNNKEEKRKRKEELGSALKEATLVPLEIVRLAKEGLSWGKDFKTHCNPNILSDLYSGISFLEASYLAGMEFIDTNLKSLKDENFIIKVREILELLTTEVENLHEKLKKR